MPKRKFVSVDTQLFTNAKISALRSMENGDSIALLWVFILCLCGRTSADGRLLIHGDIPHNVHTLACILRYDVGIIKTALTAFIQLDMIHTVVDKQGRTVYTITGWQQYQSQPQVAKNETELTLTPLLPLISPGKEKEKRKEPKEIKKEKGYPTYSLLSPIQHKSACAHVREEQTPFVPPTLQQAREYHEQKGYHFDVEQFLAYCQQTEWTVRIQRKIQPMKSWKKTMTTWQTNWRKSNPNWDWTPPTEQDISNYVKQHSLSVDSGYFWHYYDVRQWKQGNHRMTDWQDILVQWSKREEKSFPVRKTQNESTQGFTGQRDGKRYYNGYEQL